MTDITWNKQTAEDLIRFCYATNKPAGEVLEDFIASKAAKGWEVVAYLFAPLLPKRVVVFKGDMKWTDATEDTTGMYLIESIMRKSDQEVFSVGDRIDTKIYSGCIIHGFSIDNNTLCIRHSKNDLFISANAAGSEEYFKGIKKLPVPVLTTVDGKDVYEDDVIWDVYSDWSIQSWTLTHLDNFNGHKVFSTREAAEAYVTENRPVLSLKDVKDEIGCIAFDKPTTGPYLIEKLTALVKQKLNS